MIPAGIAKWAPAAITLQRNISWSSTKGIILKEKYTFKRYLRVQSPCCPAHLKQFFVSVCMPFFIGMTPAVSLQYLSPYSDNPPHVLHLFNQLTGVVPWVSSPVEMTAQHKWSSRYSWLFLGVKGNGLDGFKLSTTLNLTLLSISWLSIRTDTFKF